MEQFLYVLREFSMHLAILYGNGADNAPFSVILPRHLMNYYVCNSITYFIPSDLRMISCVRYNFSMVTMVCFFYLMG